MRTSTLASLILVAGLAAPLWAQTPSVPLTPIRVPQPETPATPAADDPVGKAISEYRAVTMQWMKDKAKPTVSERKAAADEALKNVDVTTLSMADLGRLYDSNSGGVQASSKSAQALAHVKDVAKQDDAEGARASVRLLTVFIPKRGDDGATGEANANAKRALTHPALKTIIAEKGVIAQFRALNRIEADDLKPMVGDIVRLAGILPSTADFQTASAARGLLDAALSAGSDTDTDTNPLRLKVLAMVHSAESGPAERLIAATAEKSAADAELASATDENKKAAEAKVKAAETKVNAAKNEQKALAGAATFLDGAYARGALVGYTAPEIDFMWSTKPLGSELTKLSDLKGKIVVCDFWATWCGPCVASFPNARKLQAHYTGSDVVLLGITSIQGFHIDQKTEDKDARRIDCKDDPAKEMGLMPKFMSDMEMTWNVAFAKQPVFNPEYGINGIPHVAIIDPNGVVRFRGLHPSGNEKQIFDDVDALLKEFGKTVPARENKSEGDDVDPMKK
jgi:thiol-disulfide isomerase/thioredoxin